MKTLKTVLLVSLAAIVPLPVKADFWNNSAIDEGLNYIAIFIAAVILSFTAILCFYKTATHHLVHLAQIYSVIAVHTYSPITREVLTAVFKQPLHPGAIGIILVFLFLYWGFVMSCIKIVRSFRR